MNSNEKTAQLATTSKSASLAALFKRPPTSETFEQHAVAGVEPPQNPVIYRYFAEEPEGTKTLLSEKGPHMSVELLMQLHRN